LTRVRCWSTTFPILLFIFVGLAIGIILPMMLGWACSTALGNNRPDPEKLSPYECGFEAFEDARMKFDVRYYLVAILFILFDLEIAFLFPWAIVLQEIGWFGFVLDGGLPGHPGGRASFTNGRRVRSNGSRRGAGPAMARDQRRSRETQGAASWRDEPSWVTGRWTA
jgi:NADH-quinone oxidoreductase subunit A